MSMYTQIRKMTTFKMTKKYQNKTKYNDKTIYKKWVSIDTRNQTIL